MYRVKSASDIFDDNKPLDKSQVDTLLNEKFIKVFDLHYPETPHYYVATRRDKDRLVATMSEDEAKNMIPDAVTCFVICKVAENDYRLLTFYEYRHPIGRYGLGVPAGLIDPEDKEVGNPILTAANREMKEETGLITDCYLINKGVFSSPGMTDESNALAGAVVDLPDTSVLNHNGIEGSEKMANFKLLTKDNAIKLLTDGVDEFGNNYSLMLYSAMLYFLSDLWKEHE